MVVGEQTKTFFTQRGVIWASAAVVTLAVGMASANGLLASFGVFALLLSSLCWCWGRRNLRGCTLSCQATTHCYAEAYFPVRITVANPRRFLDAFALQLEISLPGGKRSALAAPWIAAGSSAQLDTDFVLLLRGQVKQLPASLESDFPFGLWQHSRRIGLPHTLTVYPKPLVAKALVLSGVLSDTRPTAGATSGARAGEIRGLRAWRAGDSMKRIHVAASARSYACGSGLIVTEADPPGYFPRQVAVIFHSFSSERAIIRPELFERALSYLCGTLRTLVHKGIPVSFCGDFDGWIEHRCDSRQQLTLLLEHLARVQRCAATEAHDLIRAQTLVDADATLILLSDMPLPSWQQAVAKRAIPAVVVQEPTSNKMRR